jgi:Family of unknown function (DUF5335)
MPTRLIPRAEWFTFFEGFTRRYSGWRATVWVLNPRIGAQVEARDLPFEAIVADRLATAISIYLGGMPGKNVEHPVASPLSVWQEMSDEGAITALGINSSEGTTTLLEFRSPVPVELAHRVAAFEGPPLRVD